VGQYDGQIMLHKLPLKATAFDHQGHIDPVQRGTNTMLIHTRAATTGDPSDNDNNHPIVVSPRDQAPGLVGIHNGMLWNDTQLWRTHRDLADERVGEVDSQLIFQIMSRQGREALSQIEGDASIAWLDMARPDELNVARMGGRPLFGVTTEGGSFFFASTAEALTEALGHFHQLGRFAKSDMIAFAEGDWVTVADGEIVANGCDFPVITVARYYTTGTTTTSKATQHQPTWYDNWDDDPLALLPPTEAEAEEELALPFGLSPTDRATWEASMDAAASEPASDASSTQLLDDGDPTRFDWEFFHFLTRGAFLGTNVDEEVITALVELAYAKGDATTVDQLLNDFIEPVTAYDQHLTYNIAHDASGVGRE
jgi:hypothetical protein